MEGEGKLAAILFSLGIVSTISGVFISLFKSDFETWLQWNIVGHSLVSIALFLPATIYTYSHFRRTVGIRKVSVLFSGLIASALIIAVLISGLHIAINGHTEVLSWIPKLHKVLSYFMVVVIVLHIVLHLFSRNLKKRQNSSRFITFYANKLVKGSIISVVIYCLVLAFITYIYPYIYSQPVNELSSSYQKHYGEHPFSPSLVDTKDAQLIHVDQIVKSAQCGACHSEIFEQWRSSAHRQAASDPTYVKNINLLVKKKGISAARYCEGCHAPVALLTGELTEGGLHGGVKDTPAHIEGVGCMGCHGIEKVLNTSGTASYLFSPKEHYLFDSSRSEVAQKIRNFLIQSEPQKHKMAMGGHPISDPKLCATCHEQFMDKSMNDWGWIKMQSTYQEWLASPFSGLENPTNSETEQTRCQDCHFPKVKAGDPSSDYFGRVASHRSLGANTFLPLLNGDTEQFELTKKFLQSSKVLVHIEKPTSKQLISNSQVLESDLRSSASEDLPFFLYLGDTGEISVTVTNRLVGHNFPAGTTDLNQAWIAFDVVDGNGESIYSSGFLDDNHKLDKSSHIYHSTPVDRLGNLVWRHDLFRMTGEGVRNVIESGRSDIKKYYFKVPHWAKSPITVEAVLKYRKLNQRYAEWALESTDITIPIIDMGRDRLTIPLIKRHKAKSVNSLK